METLNMPEIVSPTLLRYQQARSNFGRIAESNRRKASRMVDEYKKRIGHGNCTNQH